MTISLTTKINDLLAITEEMASGELGPFDEEQQEYIDIVQENATELQVENVMQLSLIGLSVKSHDLRQLLTSIVGYSALLNSPKLSSHSTLLRRQLQAIHQLHKLARDIHWRLDSLILFANQIVRPRPEKQHEMGMLNIGGYLRAQADHYVCRPFVSEVKIPDSLPHVYANDTASKLMLRALFAIALDLVPQPDIKISAYTMMKFVRARVSIGGTATHLDGLMQLLRVQEVEEDTRNTQSVYMTIGKIQSTTLVELGLYVTTNLASQQGGRIKLEGDDDKLVFTLTMPTTVPSTEPQPPAQG